jgi:hypothetical protein
MPPMPLYSLLRDGRLLRKHVAWAPLKWPKSCALGDNSDFEQRPLRDQFCNANRSPGGIWRSDEFVFDLDERVQMFPQFHMISGHFDHVAEVKTCSFKMCRHKLECIPKLRFRIIRERQIRVHARYSRERHELPRIEDRRKMSLIWSFGKFAGYQHFAHDSSRHKMERVWPSPMSRILLGAAALASPIWSECYGLSAISS